MDVSMGYQISSSADCSEDKIKAALNVPVGRLAALRKQAFMCSG